jgi:predicted 3-demethylubiquinone-9 3-methyltransferase (glyoxalase superfamily)
LRVERYGPGEHGAEGTVKIATFTLAGQEYHCIDSPVKHDFTFTPSISLFVDCESEAELDEIFSVTDQFPSWLSNCGAGRPAR